MDPKNKHIQGLDAHSPSGLIIDSLTNLINNPLNWASPARENPLYPMDLF